MPARVTVTRPAHSPNGRVVLPPSKSLANRALVAAALAGDIGCVQNVGTADDVRLLHGALTNKTDRVNCGLGGTTFRFALAWACVQEGRRIAVTGAEELLARPHQPLLDALLSLGARLEPVADGYLVTGKRLNGGSISFDSPISSQFISALLLIAPTMRDSLTIQWTGRRLSEPYARMTVAVMRHFGVEVIEAEDRYTVAPGAYVITPYRVPGDWSAAAFWYEMLLIDEEARFELVGLQRDGLQADEVVRHWFAHMCVTEATAEGVSLSAHLPGVLKSMPTVLDLRNSPDLFQPLAFAFAARGIPIDLTGLENLRVKETDRYEAVSQTLAMMDVPMIHFPDMLHIRGGLHCHPVDWHVRGDHRMAMAMAPLALHCGRIILRDPQVVNKSYPGYWEDLRRVGFGVEFS